MTDFNIAAGTTQTVSGNLSGTNTVEGNSTAAYGAGGGTLDVTGNITNATITVTGGILVVGGDANGATINLNNALFNMGGSSGHWNSHTTINFVSGSVSGVIVPPKDATDSTFHGASFTNMANGDYISTGSNSAITGISFSSNTLNFTQNGTTYHVAVTLASGQTPNFSAQTLNGHLVLGQGTVVCFAAGTLIRTVRGEVAVEDLKAGDLVVVSSGEHRPVKWMGHRTFDFRGGFKTDPALPIRIVADAFGPGRPSQDLYLSEGHSICLDFVGETLIPVGSLVNGVTIARAEVDEITYWHVELDRHDIVIANNLPAESYLAMGNRSSFEETPSLLPALLEGAGRTHADFCRPVLTEGPVLEFVRERLLARAEEIGWTALRDPDLHLVVDGRIVSPLREQGMAAFLFPADASDVRLMSNTFEPVQVGTGDPRSLGIMLNGLCFYGSLGEPRRVALDDERLGDGVYELENHGGEQRRWTDGNLVLDPQFWQGLGRQVALLVTYDPTTIRAWRAPAAEPRDEAEARSIDRPKLYAVG